MTRPDNGLGTLVQYQIQLQKLTLDKLDGIATDLLSLRADLAKGLEKLEAGFEVSRLEGYLDVIAAAASIVRRAAAVISDGESTPSEKAKAEADLENGYGRASEASAALQNYSGAVAALGFKSSLALLSGLIAMTGRGPVALREHLQSHFGWSQRIRDVAKPRSLVFQMEQEKAIYKTRRSEILKEYGIDPGDLEDATDHRIGHYIEPIGPTIVAFKETFYVYAEEWLEQGRMIGNPRGEGIFEEQIIEHPRVSFGNFSLEYCIVLKVEASSPVPQLKLLPTKPAGASWQQSYKDHLVPAKTTETAAIASLKDRQEYRDLQAKINNAQSKIDELNAIRLLYFIHSCSLGIVRMAKNEIVRTLELQ